MSCRHVYLHSNNGDASLSLTFSRLHFFLFLTHLSSVVSEFFFSLQILIFFIFSFSHFRFFPSAILFLLFCHFLSLFLNENRSFRLLSFIVFIFFYIFFYHLSILGLFLPYVLTFFSLQNNRSSFLHLTWLPLPPPLSR